MTERIWLLGKQEEAPDQALVTVSRPSLHYVMNARTELAQPFAEVVLVPAHYFNPWSMGAIYVTHGAQIIYEREWGESRDQTGFLQEVFGAPSRPFAFVFWGATENDLAIIVNQPCFCSEPTLQVPTGTTWRRGIETIVPGYIEHYDNRRVAKMHLLREINPLNSLAELEKQVDLLGAIVMELVVRSVPEAERPAWWGRFAALLMEYDSTVLKGRDAALDDIEAQKNRIRGLIATYYQNRDGG